MKPTDIPARLEAEAGRTRRALERFPRGAVTGGITN
jgi:hypothetical protein